jgi:mycothiol synthase
MDAASPGGAIAERLQGSSEGPALFVTQFFPASASAADFEQYFQVDRAAHRLDCPGDPPRTQSAVIDRLTRPVPADRSVADWIARTASGLITGTGFMITLGAQNPRLAGIEIAVHPDYRRRGVGTSLLLSMAAEAAAGGISTLVVEGLAAGGPGAAFASVHGFAVAERTARQRLDMISADQSRWHVPVAPGYRLVRWIDAAPDDLLVSYASARNAISNRPHGETSFVDQEWTPERVRSDESTARASRQTRVVAAVHEGTSEVVGLTLLEVYHERPDMAVQQDTAVVPSHRGMRLGVSIKAANLVWLTADHPRVTVVQTSTAADNSYMLHVNEQVGFTVDLETETREADVSVLLDGLRERHRTQA